MMMQYNLKSRMVFFRFWVLYIIILCIPLGIGNFVYQKTLKIVEKDAINNNLALLSQTKDIVDGRLTEVDTLVTQLSLNPNIKNIQHINHTPQRKDIYKIYRASKELYSYGIVNRFIKDFHIYFKDSDIILTPYTSYIELPILYGHIFKYDKLSYQEWRDTILDQFYQKEYLPVEPIIFKGKESNVITYAQSFPYVNGSHGNGVVFCYIDEDEIHRLMQKLETGGEGWAYIVDKHDNILTSMRKMSTEIIDVDIPTGKQTGVIEKVIDGQSMIVSYVESSYNQWLYVAVMPREVVLAKVKPIKSLFVIFTLIILAVGLLITYFVAKRNSRPIQHALDVLTEVFTYENYEGGNIFDFLGNNIVNLTYDNKNLKDTIAGQTPFLKTAFFDRLLNGSFDDLEGMAEIANQLEFHKEDNLYLVVLIQIYGYEKLVSINALNKLNLQKAAIKETFYDTVDNSGYIHDVGIDQLALVLAFSRKQQINYKELIESLIQKIKRKACLKEPVKFRCAAGEIYENLFDIVQSFNEAKRVLDANMFVNKDDTVSWYEIERDNNSNTYYYPIELEMKLTNFVKAGNEEKMQKLLNEIFIENFFRRDLPVFMKHQFINELKGTIIKLLNQIIVEEKEVSEFIGKWFTKLDECQTIDHIYDFFINICKNMCEIVNKTKQSRNTDLIMRIIEYIDANFTDSNLGLASIADYFNITETYLSQFFKEQTGENFSIYLERIRMEYADKLLIESNLKVDQVALKAGYNSANTFRRAYKRYYGIRPTERREVFEIELSRRVVK